MRVRTVDLDPEELRLAYDVVSNETLWFAHHGMLDGYSQPTFDAAWFAAWDAFRRVNAAFAAVVAEVAPEGAAVLVQDYHLPLVAAALAEARPDVSCVHFSHTPFARPAELALLPERVRSELMGGLAAHRACGFHSPRWAGAARGCGRAVGVDLTTFVAPLGPDEADLHRTADGAACAAALADLDARVGDRAFLVRVDRIELSKNIRRGFLAFDQVLRAHPEWRERVTFGAFVYPSRENVPAYRRYREGVDATVAEVNERWSTDDWTPILYETDDDFPRSVAALRRADVVLVNPIRDGLNLVAKEAALLADREVVVCLSEGAGAHDELGGGDAALTVDAWDVVAAAETLHRALAMDDDERSRRFQVLRQRAGDRTPATWLEAQLAQAGPPA